MLISSQASTRPGGENTGERTYHLHFLPLFAGLESERLWELLDAAQWVELPSGAELVHDTRNHSLILVVGGAFEVRCEDLGATTTAGRGTLINGVWPVGGYAGPLKVQALTPAVALMLDSEAMERLRSSNSPIPTRIENQLARAAAA